MEYTKTVWKDLPDTSTPITADKLNNLENGVEYLFEHGVGGDTLPIGIILPFTDEEIPTGYMLCDGSAISRTTYSDLFSIIGTTYGEGDGSTTFNLPNLKGRVPVGRDITDTDFDTLGETGGEKEHTLTINEMPSHNHGYIRSTMGGQGEIIANTDLSSGYSRYGLKYQLTDTTSGQLNTNYSGENEAHNILQPYQIVNYIIKVSQTTATQAQVVDVYSASTTDSYSCNYTNQIVESGSNENGDWIKYANGNLICYGSASIQSPTYSDWYSFCRATNDMTATLPTAFKDNDYKITATSFSFGYFGMLTRTKNTNSFVFKGFTHNQSAYNPGDGTFDYIAIGKWK